MKSRTCPRCGYTYSLREYYSELFLKHPKSDWKCKQCRTSISFDHSWRKSITMYSMIVIMLLPVLIFIFDTTLLPSLILIFFDMLFAIFLFSFDRLSYPEE
ncbi:MAG TPA: hypothetical protein VE912_09940 [Bacteroidales bacterium]|nr:hypothetical protein [Bacteroidales bacterium]